MDEILWYLMIQGSSKEDIEFRHVYRHWKLMSFHSECSPSHVPGNERDAGDQQVPFQFTTDSASFFGARWGRSLGRSWVIGPRGPWHRSLYSCLLKFSIKSILDSGWGFLSWSLCEENHSPSRARLRDTIIMIFLLQTRSPGHCARPAGHRGPGGADMTWSSWLDFSKKAACRSSVSRLASLELACLFGVRRGSGPLERNYFRTLNSSLITSNTHSTFFVSLL